MLSGIRVVEIAGIGPGPFCAMHLADLGADVIAIERGGATSDANLLNRGKRSIVLDLKTSTGREVALDLIADADALIEGMRPGAMERLGLGPAECHARNPRLVFGRMTGWGQTGPLSRAAGHDNNYTALSGALYYNGAPTEPPSSAFAQLGDVGGGALYLMVGLLAGILSARKTGKGCVVDAAIVDGSAHMTQLLLAASAHGLVAAERGQSIHDSSHFYATYRCSDGEFITIGAFEPQFYTLLLQKLGLETDSRFGQQWDRSRWTELRESLAQLFATNTRDEWCALLENTDACFSPVLSPSEAAMHPHNVARSVYFQRDGFLQAAPAPRFNSAVVTPGQIPAPGEHTEQILAALRDSTKGSVWKTS
jgi:alpha-methylacyl-CoA racemase